jgi:hypothetical protein
VIVFAFKLEPWESVAPAFAIAAMVLFWQELRGSDLRVAGETSAVR